MPTFLAAQELLYEFSRGEVSLFSPPRNDLLTVRGTQHQVKLSILTSVSR